MIDQLRQTCRDLLDDGTVQVVIGYGQSDPDAPAHPVFITRPEDVRQLVWNQRCFGNLTTYLTRKEVRALGKPAIVVKGCDERALLVLERESQIDRSEIVVIGVACQGMIGPLCGTGVSPVRSQGSGIGTKCSVCEVHVPRFADVVVGDAPDAPSEPIEPGRRYADLAGFMARPPQERMAFWMREFERCVKCYACRQVCPLCYCEQCIVDKNRPIVIDTSATLKGNFAWHITRAFHLAGRCVGCDECTRACPAGIDLRLLNMSLARAAEESFGFRAGTDQDAEPVIGGYSLKDKERFIR